MVPDIFRGVRGERRWSISSPMTTAHTHAPSSASSPIPAFSREACCSLWGLSPPPCLCPLAPSGPSHTECSGCSLPEVLTSAVGGRGRAPTHSPRWIGRKGQNSRVGSGGQRDKEARKRDLRKLSSRAELHAPWSKNTTDLQAHARARTLAV